MTNLVYLSLGSNIEPEKNVRAAVEMLATLAKVQAVSSVWETLPLGLTDQPNFLNAAAVVETKLTAKQFKRQVIRRIERVLGRVRTADKFGPRSIDIDIILFNRDIFELDNQPIPNRELLERPFVGIPLAEIAPDYIHPETGQALSEIVAGFSVTEADMRLRVDVSLALTQSKPFARSARKQPASIEPGF
jgi:2-amino-4-hydroxy-6-hydroxymethyldihydropteridine diphosphokinase